ncbi:MAG: Smr/MutS family protein [Sphingobium sp.]|uniref:Smr/MutS family protein n=1 Tax=Sphingobium sp. TaxID=1912891 RepID=UPI002E1C6626
MVRRRLSAEEEALWSALTRSVRPLRPGARASKIAGAAPPAQTPPIADPPQRLTIAPQPILAAPPARSPAPMLDSSWERRIRGGTISPDMSIDLHGDTLAAAHARLDQAIAAALARDARVLLVVTGKPPKSGMVSGSSRRGAIRAEIGHWLETSRHADRIASVRVAHPRHGGDGALYLILRRKK